MMSTGYTKRLRSNFIALSLVQGTNFLLPLVVMPYVISKTGTDGFGVIAVAQAAMIYLSTIADYGFNLTATRDIAIYSDDHEKISAIFFTVLASKLVICAFLFIIVVLATSVLPFFKEHAALYNLGFIYVIGQSLLVSWFFQGKEKMHYITISTLMARMIFAMLVFYFIREKTDGDYFVFFLGLGNVLAGVVSIIVAVRVFRLRFQVPSWASIRRELKEGWQVTVSNISISTYLYSGIFILRLFTNDTIVGSYGIAERIFFAVRQVLAIFSQAVYPQVCQLSQEGKKPMQVFIQRVYRPFLLLMILGCIALFILAPWVIHFFIKGQADLSVVILRMLSVVPVIVCLNIPAYQLLVAFNYKKAYAIIFSVATLINIIINLALVRHLGATGTALTIILTELFITVVLNLILYKHNMQGYIKAGSD